MWDTDLDAHERRTLGTDGTLRRRTREQYARRRALAALLLAAVIGGGYFGVTRLRDRLAGRPELAATQPLPFSPERYLTGPDLDGDGKPEQVAIGPAENAMRKLALVTGTGRVQLVVGPVITIPDFPVQFMDLPRASGVLVLSGLLPAEGRHRSVTVGGQPALEAAGGEPDFLAWRPDRTDGLVPVDFYPLRAPKTSPHPTAIVVDKGLNVLWFYENGELAATYRVATGRHLNGPAPSDANQAANQLTPTGSFIVANRFRGLPYYKDGIPAEDPRNPLGTRWLGFSVFPGDNGLLWALRGTNQPDLIGRWASQGSILLTNPDIEALYERVKVGTPLEIVNSVPVR